MVGQKKFHHHLYTSYHCFSYWNVSTVIIAIVVVLYLSASFFIFLLLFHTRNFRRCIFRVFMFPFRSGISLWWIGIQVMCRWFLHQHCLYFYYIFPHFVRTNRNYVVIKYFFLLMNEYFGMGGIIYHENSSIFGKFCLPKFMNCVCNWCFYIFLAIGIKLDVVIINYFFLLYENRKFTHGKSVVLWKRWMDKFHWIDKRNKKNYAKAVNWVFVSLFLYLFSLL